MVVITITISNVTITDHHKWSFSLHNQTKPNILGWSWNVAQEIDLSPSKNPFTSVILVHFQEPILFYQKQYLKIYMNMGLMNFTYR